MESDSHSSIEENDVQDKQEHIKQRLKDLGVSEESERPAKSWFSRYRNYLIATVIVVLAAVYWFEYRSQNGSIEQPLAQTNTSIEPMHNSDVYYPHPNFNQTPNPQQQRWMQQQDMYRQAMQQREIRRQAWIKQVREQQLKGRQAWDKYIRQQQTMSQRGMPEQNSNPYYGGPYPPFAYQQHYPNSGW